ncbi:N-acetylmuramoyl-L-alanine amidase family protein [Slackia heliotrinireducens]|uniref:N-acetylmuramoyl-L-alanine amidase family protein n=1 Tax=Slackia heliotrinireducens TaxID=84110 RepID=UPI0033150BBF
MGKTHAAVDSGKTRLWMRLAVVAAAFALALGAIAAGGAQPAYADAYDDYGVFHPWPRNDPQYDQDADVLIHLREPVGGLTPADVCVTGIEGGYVEVNWGRNDCVLVLDEGWFDITTDSEVFSDIEFIAGHTYRYTCALLVWDTMEGEIVSPAGDPGWYAEFVKPNRRGLDWIDSEAEVNYVNIPGHEPDGTGLVFTGTIKAREPMEVSLYNPSDLTFNIQPFGTLDLSDIGEYFDAMMNTLIVLDSNGLILLEEASDGSYGVDPFCGGVLHYNIGSDRQLTAHGGPLGGGYTYDEELGEYYEEGSGDIVVSIPSNQILASPDPGKLYGDGKILSSVTLTFVDKLGWQSDAGLWRYICGNGLFASGWQKVGKSWYYFDADSNIMKTGWLKLGKTWYYLAPKKLSASVPQGAMVTGWNKIGGKWYWFANSGAMVTGWKQISGKWYLFDSKGAMLTGWQKVGSSWYYLAPTKLSPSLPQGAMATGWLKIGGTWYYFFGNGKMATGTQTIGGKTYRFSGSGAWIS